MLGCWEKEETGTDREDEREVTHFFKRNQGDKFRKKKTTVTYQENNWWIAN